MEKRRNTKLSAQKEKTKRGGKENPSLVVRQKKKNEGGLQHIDEITKRKGGGKKGGLASRPRKGEKGKGTEERFTAGEGEKKGGGKPFFFLSHQSAEAKGKKEKQGRIVRCHNKGKEGGEREVVST